MANVVLDTNIIISAALSPQGTPAKIVDLVLDNEEIQLYYSVEIFAEYKRVLAYKRLNIKPEIQQKILDKISIIAVSIEPTPSAIPMPDEADRIFYDVALASGAILITGNRKHFPDEPFIMTPADFAQEINN